MYRVLIVDDELIVRIGLKMAVNWEENGFDLIGEACNGKQALEIISKNQPDIVISDIKMPVMDGIQLIKELSANYPDIKVLVLSNYEDFDYVKEALKNGASDYLLKVTVEPEKLIEILRIICEKIEKERDNQKGTKEIKRRLDISMLEVNKRNLNSLIKSAVNKEKFMHKVKSAGQDFFHEEGFLLFVTVPDYEEIIHNRFDGDSELFQITLYNFIKGIINERSLGNMVEYGENGFVILVTGNRKGIDGIDKVMADQIKDAVKNSLSIDIIIVFNIWYQDIEKFRNLLIKLEEIKLLGFYENGDRLIDFEVAKSQWESINYSNKNKKSDLQIYIKMPDINKFKAFFDEFISEAKNKRVNPKLLKNWLSGMLEYSKECFLEYYGEQILNDGLQISYGFENCSTYTELMLSYMEIMDEFEKMFNIISEVRWREDILRVMEFIEDNISKQITLEMVSKLIYMNKSYFCRLFKKETGENFQDYVTKVRMQKASQLLMCSNSKVSDLALQVGYKDIFYFNRVFKSFYGLPPGEYRNKFSKANSK